MDRNPASEQKARARLPRTVTQEQPCTRPEPSNLLTLTHPHMHMALCIYRRGLSLLFQGLQSAVNTQLLSRKCQQRAM